MSSRHGKPLRGLMASKSSPHFEGFFGRMFRALRPATFGATEAETAANLGRLADKMTATPDPIKDGQDAEESGIPSLYTYLGQFIDHDLTFDPSSSLQKQNDPDAIVDFRTPAFDLDNVYGRGPDDQPYLYDGPMKFLLGDAIGGGAGPVTDLPRNSGNPRRALIGDPRNDENVIVSQLQGLFLRFHNRLVKENPILSFADAQRLVRYHYQYVVVNDFLPRLVHSKVIAALKSNGQYDKAKLRFYHFRNLPFMPVEFATAAYRLGHSMVRPGYRLNDADATLLPIFAAPGEDPKKSLVGFQAMNPAWGIDWGRFIDIDIRAYDKPGDIKKRLQFAYRLDTSAVNPLGNLPASVASDPSSLPLRNLLRSWRLGLPNGQSVARAMGIKPMDDAEILLGKFTEDPGEVLVPITTVSPAFKHNCPLWTYILAETRTHKEPVKLPVTENVTLLTPKLGPVGGRIVAEVFLGIMFGDSNSFLSQDPDWHPATGANYMLKDFVRYALEL